MAFSGEKKTETRKPRQQAAEKSNESTVEIGLLTKLTEDEAPLEVSAKSENAARKGKLSE